MKKKIGTVVMAAAMACTICTSAVLATGCGNSITDFVMPPDGFDPNTKVTIYFGHTMNQDLQKVLESYIEQFEALYPNITVKHEPLGGYDDVRSTIITRINAGTQPNLAYCYPDHVAMFNQSGAVLPLNGFLPDGEYKDYTVTRSDGVEEPIGFTQAQKDAFIQGYWEEGYKFDDGDIMYTLPFAKSTEVMYYNKTFFEENGLNVPTTWIEMEEVCAKIKELKPDCKPLGYDSEANWFITMCEQSNSPYTALEGENFLFDNATNRKFVETFKGWYDKGYFTTQAINKAYTSNLFREQSIYMCIGSTAGAKNQLPKRVDGQYPWEVGVAPIPQVDPENPRAISQGPSVCIFKQDNPQEVIASVMLAKFLTTSPGFQAQFSSVAGYEPVITTVMENETYKNNLDNANGYGNLTYLAAKVCMEQASAYYTSPAFVGSSKAREQVGLLMQAVFTGSKTIDKAFTDAIYECKYAVG